MPARNKKQTKEAAALREPTIVVGEVPRATAPGLIKVKALQDALIDGLANPAQFARDFLDCTPYPKQEEFLLKSRDCVEANFSAGNRTGKTWTDGIILLWRAFYRYISPFTAPEYTSPHVTYKAVSTSLTHDQAKLAWNYALTFSESKRFKPFVADVVHSPFPTITLVVRDERGEKVKTEIWSRSLAKKGVYLLGQSIGFLLADECAYIPDYPQIEDEVIRMRLADQGGSLFRTSTPNGRNHFFTYYQQGGSGDPRYYSQMLTTWDNPYVPRAFLEEQRERMLPEYYAQNVMGEFVSLSDFFKLEHIQQLYNGVDYPFPMATDTQGVYVMGVDLGAAQDPTVVCVLRIDVEPAQLVFLLGTKNTNWRAQRALVATVWGDYKPAKTYIDATGVGAPIAQQLIEEDGLQNTVAHIITHANKPDTLVRLQDAVQRRKWVFPFNSETKELISQLSFYRLDDKGIKQDYVLGAAMMNLAWEDYLRAGQFSTTIYPDLAAIDVLQNGRGLGGVEMTGRTGTLFTYDARTGMFLPSQTGVTLPADLFEGEDEDGFPF
jgi:uncharacterized protein (UPF0297 family)